MKVIPISQDAMVENVYEESTDDGVLNQAQRNQLHKGSTCS